eukprot:431361_1
MSQQTPMWIQQLVNSLSVTQRTKLRTMPRVEQQKWFQQKLTEKRQHLFHNRQYKQTWLKFNGLIENTKDDILIECMNEIINLFGGVKSILKLMAKSVNRDYLQPMYQIVKTQKLKHENDKPINENNENIYQKQHVFSTIPYECISYICGYLLLFS